jgi:hypothetical protein
MCAAERRATLAPAQKQQVLAHLVLTKWRRLAPTNTLASSTLRAQKLGLPHRGLAEPAAQNSSDSSLVHAELGEQ